MDDFKESVSDSLLTRPEDRGQTKSNYKERHKCRSQPKWTRKTHKRYIQGTKESPKKSHRRPRQLRKPRKISSEQSSSSETSSTSSSTETTEGKTSYEQKEARAIEQKERKIQSYICKLDAGDHKGVQERASKTQSYQLGNRSAEPTIRHGRACDSKD